MADGAWYYAAGGSQKGPVSREQMSALVDAGAVTGETLVWAQGMGDWQPLSRSDLAGLVRPRPPAPPPMPPQHPAEPAPSAVERTRPEPVPPAWSPAQPTPGQGYARGPTQAGQGYAPPGYVPALEPIGMGAAVSRCFSKYATFAGRARLAEFWYFYLFVVLVQVVSSIIGVGAMGEPNAFAVIGGIAGLVLILPMISVTVRRLHDTNRSGWWYWIALIPLVGVIVLIGFLVQSGTPGDNQYGPPPT